MASVIQTKAAVNMKLDNGATETGAQKLVSQTLGKLKPTLDMSTNASAIFAVVNNLSLLLNKRIVRIECVNTGSLTNE